MEEILLNPGYHFIAQRILSNLDSKTLSSLSQTSKRIMKVCKEFIIKEGQGKSVFKILDCQSCEEIFTDMFQDFVTFVKENEIFYDDYFKPLKAKRERKHILVQFLEKLIEFTIQENFSLLQEQVTNSKILRKCLCPFIFFVCPINRKIQLITNQYAKFIPSNCPTESRDHLIQLLAFAISWEEMDMVKILLASLKNHDSCLRLIITAFKYHRKAGTSTKNHYRPLNDRKFQSMEKIIVQCKNPNAPNKSGSTAMHLVAKLGLHKIARILLPYCNNLDTKDQDGKTALDIANEKRHFKIVKLLNSAL